MHRLADSQISMHEGSYWSLSELRKFIIWVHKKPTPKLGLQPQPQEQFCPHSIALTKDVTSSSKSVHSVMTSFGNLKSTLLAKLYLITSYCFVMQNRKVRKKFSWACWLGYEKPVVIQKTEARESQYQGLLTFKVKSRLGW